MNKALLWIKAARPQFFTATFVPIMLGAVIAWNHIGKFNWTLFWLTLIGGIFIHAGLNFGNDYYDDKSRNDVVNKTPTPFSGGSRMIQKKIFTASEVRVASLICFAIGSAIGLYLNFTLKGNVILILGIIGVFLAYFYTAPPIKLGYRKTSEVTVALGFGPIMLLGSYYVQAERFSWGAFWTSLPIAILIALVLCINEFPDYEADKTVGKNNMVVTLGKEKAIRHYRILLILTYCLIASGVILKVFPVFALITLLTLPWALKAIRITMVHFNQVDELLPANALTVGIHFSFGLLFTLAYYLDGLIR